MIEEGVIGWCVKVARGPIFVKRGSRSTSASIPPDRLGLPGAPKWVQSMGGTVPSFRKRSYCSGVISPFSLASHIKPEIIEYRLRSWSAASSGVMLMGVQGF